MGQIRHSNVLYFWEVIQGLSDHVEHFGNVQGLENAPKSFSWEQSVPKVFRTRVLKNVLRAADLRQGGGTDFSRRTSFFLSALPVANRL
jgi:hypothetical protein